MVSRVVANLIADFGALSEERHGVTPLGSSITPAIDGPCAGPRAPSSRRASGCRARCARASSTAASPGGSRRRWAPPESEGAALKSRPNARPVSANLRRLHHGRTPHVHRARQGPHHPLPRQLLQGQRLPRAVQAGGVPRHPRSPLEPLLGKPWAREHIDEVFARPLAHRPAHGGQRRELPGAHAGHRAHHARSTTTTSRPPRTSASTCASPAWARPPRATSATSWPCAPAPQDRGIAIPEFVHVLNHDRDPPLPQHRPGAVAAQAAQRGVVGRHPQVRARRGRVEDASRSSATRSRTTSSSG